MDKIKQFLLLALIFSTIFVLFPRPGFCDMLRLKEIPEGKEGNTVEVLEEGVDSFIVRIPKDEIEFIKGEDYSEVKLWREKNILWEDQDDYITIFLPKERIVTPKKGKDKEGTYYGRGEIIEEFKEAITSTGAKVTYDTSAIPSQAKGNIIGRIFDGASPEVGCKIKIVYIKGQSDILSKLFGGGASAPEDGEDIVLETKTDKNGVYEFSGVPVGSYDLFWLPRGGNAWIRKLSEKPSVTVLPGKTVQYEDINLR